MYWTKFILFGISGLFFLLAYFIYLFLFFFIKRLFLRGSMGAELTKSLRSPTLALFFALAAYMSLDILPLSDAMYAKITHLITIAFIATIGWGLIAVTKTVQYFLREKKEREEADEGAKRTFITQTQIFYRVIVFLIVVVTFGAILMTFPQIKNLGLGLLGSAGVAGIALGIAARPMLLNLMAGFQIAFTKMVKIGDQVVLEGEGGIVEQIFLTHVIIKTSDLRRLTYPISYFIDKPFQNWSRISAELLATVYLYVDFAVPVADIRAYFESLLLQTPLWNKNTAALDVTNMKENNIELRLTMSANNAKEAFNLSCFVREAMIAYLQKEYPEAFPHLRQTLISNA